MFNRVKLQNILDERGTAALEFAIIAPLFLLTVFTMIAYGIYLGAAHSVQQISADAARSAIAGLSQEERQSLAQAHIENSLKTHPLLDPRKMHIHVRDSAASPSQFTVEIAYDAQHLPVWSLYSYALPNPRISAQSTIRIGGL